MPKPLDLPPDLVELQRVEDAAAAAIRECVRFEGEWTDERLAELDRLRKAYTDAAAAIYDHPTMLQAKQENCHHQTRMALKNATKEPAEV